MQVTVTEALKLMAIRAGKSIAQLSREMECGTPANLVTMINRGSMKIKTGALYGECCGYKLMFVPEDVEVEGIEIGAESYDD